jgi:hypothetical protein
MSARRRRRLVRETFTLSFLDVLCCSLGATVVLFLGFVSSSGRASAPGGLLNGHFVDFQFTVEPEALLHIVIETPRGERLEVTGQELDGDGFIREAVRSWSGARVFGMGDDATLIENGKRVYKVAVFDPAPGAWKFDARYVDRSLEASLVQPLAPAELTRRIMTTTLHPIYASRRVQFGATTAMPAFVVSDESPDS